MDLEKLLKMSGKEDDSSPDMDKVKAKMQVIQELRKMASDMMGDKLDSGLNKVTVASDDSEGLEKGLDMAKDVVDELPEEMEEMEAKKSDSYEPEESYEEESEDEMPQSVDEIEAKIAELMALKKQMMMQE